MNIENLYTPKLSKPAPLVKLVGGVLYDMKIIADINIIEVENEEDALWTEYLGSPTIRVDGIDVEPNITFGKSDFGLRSRTYDDDGKVSAIPSREMIEETIEVGHLAELNMLGNCC